MIERSDRRMMLALQGVVLALPLFLGGRQAIAAAVAAVVVLVLLACTVVARRRAGGGPPVPGLVPLTAFVALALATTVPVPPTLIRLLSPATARLYAAALPGWPETGGWSAWRSLALDPWAAWVEIGHFAIALGAYAVITAYPWGGAPADRQARAWAFGRLVLTLVAGGVALASLGLVQQVVGGDEVMWVTSIPAIPGRASGPFVNPNHFAAWLEMVLPIGIAYGFGLLRRVRRGVVRSAQAGRGIGVSARRAWVSALVVHQQRLWAPLVVLTAVLLMAVAHVATGSRGGTAALFVGLAVAAAGVVGSGARERRWLPVALAAGLVVASAASVVVWAGADAGQDNAAVEQVDVSLSSRLAVAAKGAAIVRDYPILGTGLGAWLHAFRPYVEPPIEGGIWDHAHNDYLELAAETGVAGAGLALAFALAVVRALRRRRHAAADDAAPASFEPEMPRGFRRPDWEAALVETPYVRWGVVGGLAAILVHSLVDFGLRLPANLLVAMVLVALLLLGTRPQARRTPALAPLLALLALALVPQGANAVLLVAGGRPLSPHDSRDKADLTLAEAGRKARGEALALLDHALDWSPADRETHEQLADALGEGARGDNQLRIALALEPWSAEVRDQLGMRLLARGRRKDGLAELEESMYRFPYLASHAYLSPDLEPESADATRLIRALADGDTISLRLASLEPDVAAAIERGLTRALAAALGGEDRASILNDKVTLLEARERWADAAAVLAQAAEEDKGSEGGLNLARAGRDYLKALDYTAAERAMLAAVVRMPDQGDLYRDLAVEVYAARDDYYTADSVLDAGQRNAVDMLPVYEGVTTVLARREATSPDDDFVGPPEPRSPREDEIP